MQVDLNRTTRKRPHSTRCTIPDRLSYLCRRKSNESFACVGSFSPDLVSHSRFQSLSYDDLLQKSQTQKYHYQKHLDILAQKAQSPQSTPHRCSFLFYLRADKGDQADLSMQTVDMVYNVRWLRLISEVEKAVNTRPFRPIRAPPKPDRTAALEHEKRSAPLDSHIPFPIPPTQSFPIKNRTSTETREIKATGIPKRDEVEDDHCELSRRLQQTYYDSKYGGTDLFESGFDFRQSQELQMERWDHLVQLERRAREASEEGLRKASLGSTTSLSSNVPSFPPRKLSSGILNRMRRPSTATKESKSSLSISNPIAISPLESSFLLGKNLAQDFEFCRPDLYQIQSFSKPDLSSHPALKMPDLTLGRVEQYDRAPSADAHRVGSEVPKRHEFSPISPLSRRDLPRPRGPRPPRLSIHSSNSSLADVALTPQPSMPQHESTDKTTTSDLTTQHMVYPDVPPLRIIKRSLRLRNETPAPEHCKLIPEEPVVCQPKSLGQEFYPRCNHDWDTKMKVEPISFTSSLDELILKDVNNSQLRSGTTSSRISGALPTEYSVDLGSKLRFEDAKRNLLELPVSNSRSQLGSSSNHLGDENLAYIAKGTSKSIRDNTLDCNQSSTTQETPLSNAYGSRHKIEASRHSFPDQPKPNGNIENKSSRIGQISTRYTVPLDTKKEEMKVLNQVSPKMILPSQYLRSRKDLNQERTLYQRTPFHQPISKPDQSLEKSSESLIFELPIKPQRDLNTQINDQKVKQAWESVSHYKKWTGMNRPNIQGVVRIQGGRLKQ
ncbi:uncharacterized protein MELLADRAFT_58830 [Melampsora larici-populina 98AG31]|uniref:Uncharacterized protein n=1 Tax=Melampsora larici-populina (strain 98AG31 / pathotype 3-4-7) TaxID=747676 RepID=F4R2Z2_MELLP|nr:uncharacterized protein MELLADRAFT_58830 [Melampsora larici-populina 98AG31]EGG12903.1 hypothetical protein MELLADRAFT_58830 [Melampsora larici-populina 98AG31]